MKTKANLTRILIGVLIGILLSAWFMSRNEKLQETSTTHQEVIEKIEAIGKLELVRMDLQDVIEHQVIRQWLPNAKAILIAYGEAAGCIDLQKIKPDDIYVSGDSISIQLPQPELCYCKVDHNKSRIMDTQFNFLSGANIVDGAYKEAEKQMTRTVLKAGILEQTKTNAIAFFFPFFQSMGFKHCYIHFEELRIENGHIPKSET